MSGAGAIAAGTVTAGADLSAGADTFDQDKRVGRRAACKTPDGAHDYSDEAIRDGGGRVTLRIFESLKPVIAAINGPAVGIGATMLLPMDIRLASEEARIGFVFSRRGVVMDTDIEAGHAVTNRLARGQRNAATTGQVG